MTVKECYEMLQGNYEDAKGRMMSDRLVEKFMLKFLQDGTMTELRQALAAEDYELAFRAAHTLKGVSANLSFTALQEAASAVTEALRNDKTAPAEALVTALETVYEHTIQSLEQYQA